MKKEPNIIYRRIIKRSIDVFCSLLVLVLFCWLYIVLAVLVRVKLGSPILFKQERPGLIDAKTGRERIFKLYKFRTMTDACDNDGVLLPDSERLTSFGSWLRKTSLDEIPEFINILKGDMSLIGPRPLLVRYLDRYSEEQHRRHEVRPGLTGYAQAHGRNALTWEEKFKMDVWYVDHVSFITDFRILMDTVRVVLMREGISGEGTATMTEFMGNSDDAKV